MPNGAPGDHPITDILFHGLEVYSSLADSLIREIVQLGGRDLIEAKLYGEYSPYLDPDVQKLEAELTSLRDELVVDARERGWEI